MEKLSIKLKNCYGIKKLKSELDFSDSSVVAIYASNGMMKTSFAKTFRDLSEGVGSKDNVYPDNTTIRKIKDERNNDLPAEDIFVIERYNTEYKSEKISTLLANDKLRKKHADIHKEIDIAKNDLFNKLGELSGLDNESVENVLEKDFENDFFDILEIMESKIIDDYVPKFPQIMYNKIFSEKAKSFLNIKNNKDEIKEYVEKYDELINKSKYCKSEFNYYNISSVQKNLKNNGFFKANNSILLGIGTTNDTITKDSDFKTLIQKEKIDILDDPKLTEKWDNIHRKLIANIELRSFEDYLLTHKDILPSLVDLKTFAKELWISYFIAQKDLCHDLLKLLRNGKKESEKIIKDAKEQESDWKNVIEIFHKRFDVPFKIVVENEEDVILKNVYPRLVFKFKSLDKDVPIVKGSLLKILSSGELRALYLLNIIFEVQARKKSRQTTLFIIDDIADSFDYKNKYAIIQYLEEISKEPFFKLIILTHNFDFFRTIESRNIVKYSNCFLTCKTNDTIKLEPAKGIKNIFINDWLSNLGNPKILIASIPFARNIIEYTKGKENLDYKKLSSLLHFKDDTENILVSDLIKIFVKTFSQISSRPTYPKKQKIIDVIFLECEKCLKPSEGINFENKIILSIGIRLKSEKHISSPILQSQNKMKSSKDERFKAIKQYFKNNLNEKDNMEILDEVNLITPENIHLNSFMYEPILDMSDKHLIELYKKLNKF